MKIELLGSTINKSRKWLRDPAEIYTDLPWSQIVPLVCHVSWPPSVPWGFACEAAPYLESSPVRTKKETINWQSITAGKSTHFTLTYQSVTIPTFPKTPVDNLSHAFCNILTEGEQESGGVSWRASSGWFPDQSREGDVLEGSTLVMTPPLDSSCSILTPTPAMLTSPAERRCSAGGLGSTILLEDKHST